ncbi:MAG: AI-2E family transporter [Candidatus Saccharimonadales bacterium]
MTTTQKRSLSVAVIIALLFGIYFLWGYFILIVFAAILAFIYNSSYHWFLRKTKQRVGLSITLTMLFALVSIVIPLVVILALTVNQAIQFVDVIRNASIDSDSVKQTLTNLINSFNATVSHIPGASSSTVSLDSMTAWVKDNLAGFTKSVINYLVSVVGGVSAFFTKSIIFIFIFISMLKNQDRIISTLRKLNPLGEKVTDLYIGKISAMTRAMVKGQFIIAFLQGLTDAALLWLVGIDFFFFWLVLLTFLSIIPLGGGIIVLPIGFIMLFTGHIWQGLVLILGHLLIVTNIDNVLRPRLVPKTARLDSALTILSVFAGLAMFGFLGIVIGPVIMIIIVTTIQVYIDFVESGGNDKKLFNLFSKD